MDLDTSSLAEPVVLITASYVEAGGLQCSTFESSQFERHWQKPDNWCQLIRELSARTDQTSGTP
jgi:hypothetical protein